MLEDRQHGFGLVCVPDVPRAKHANLKHQVTLIDRPHRVGCGGAGKNNHSALQVFGPDLSCVVHVRYYSLGIVGCKSKSGINSDLFLDQARPHFLDCAAE